MPITNFHTFNYKGNVYPVNPKYDELGGYKCYPSLLDIPEKVDCVIIRLPAASCADVLRQCAGRDIHAAIVIAGGFAEVGSEGAALEAELKKIADDNAICVNGPNGMGIFNVSSSIPLYMSNALPKVFRPGRVGFMAQSGSILIGFFGADFGLGYSHVISSGNQTVLGPGDYLRFLADDENTGVIAMYLESIGDVESFKEGLEMARARKKPVIALKAGRSEKGRLATVAHTGSLAGSYDVFTSFADRHNLVVAKDLEELIINCKLFSEAGYRRIARGIGVSTVSGGHKVLAQDLGEDIGLEFAELNPEVKAALSGVLPSISHIENPVDVTGIGVGNYDIQYGVMKALASGEEIGTVVMMQDSCPNLGDGISTRYGVHAAAAAAVSREHPDKLVIFLNGISNGFSDIIASRLEGGNVIYMAGMRNSLIALRNYLKWTDGIERGFKTVPCVEANAARKKKWMEALDGCRGRTLPDDMAFDLLRDYGLPVAPFEVVHDAEGAAEAAKRLGYPVALKSLLDGVSHKSELDLIRLGIQDEPQLAVAYGELAPKAAVHNLSQRGFLVQKMAPGDNELLVALKYEKGFGYSCVCALGGVFVEIFHDSALTLLPLASGDIEGALRRLKGYPLLRGARGRAVVDTGPIENCAPALNQIAAELGEYVDVLEMNPLIASPSGVWAVDALLEVRGCS
jgi:acyl-CoA synthetase (NDP forming)